MENYEKKYKDLINALQEARNDESKKGYTFCSVIDGIVPELKESEDEKIRKYIINFINLNKGINLSPEDADGMLAWLEKQGE